MHDPLLLFSNMDEFNDACTASHASCISFKEYFKELRKIPSSAFVNSQSRLRLALAYAGSLFQKEPLKADQEKDFSYLEVFVPQFLVSSLYTHLYFRTSNYYSLTDCKYHGIPFTSDKRINDWVFYASDNNAGDADGIKKNYYVFKNKKRKANPPEARLKSRDPNFSKNVKYNISRENGGIIQRAADFKYPNDDLGQLFISSFMPELSKQAILSKCISTRNIENQLLTSKSANVTRLKEYICTFIKDLTASYCVVLGRAFDRSRVNSYDSLLELAKAESRTGILQYLHILSTLLSENNPELPESLSLSAIDPFLFERIIGFDKTEYQGVALDVIKDRLKHYKDSLRSMHNIAIYVYSQIWDIADKKKKISEQEGYFNLSFEEKYGVSSFEDLFIYDLEEVLREYENPYFSLETAYSFIRLISSGQMLKTTENLLPSLKLAKSDMITAIASFTVRYFSNLDR